PPETGTGRALARYDTFGYRRGHPGRHRHRRGQPGGPRAWLTTPRVGGQSPARASALSAPANHRSESTVFAPAVRDSGGRRRSAGPSARAFGTPFKPPARPRTGDSMATATAPSREDFAKLLDESFGGGNLQEGSGIKGKVVAVEKEFAVIDVGLKTEGRVALREFTGPGRQAALKVGDEVEVYLERVENALGEAVLSRDKARREESWGKLEKA